MFYAFNGLARLLVKLGLAQFNTVVEESGQTFTTFHTLGMGGMLAYLALIVLSCILIPLLVCSVAMPRIWWCRVGKKPAQKSVEIKDIAREMGIMHAVACMTIEAVLCYACIQLGAVALHAPGASIAAFFCVMGSAFPVWHKMRGARGFETAAICALILSPTVFAFLLVIWAIVLIGMRYATPARLFAVLLYPLISRAFVMESNPTMVLLSVAVVALMLFTHWKNVRAMLDREEPKILLWKKKTEEK